MVKLIIDPITRISGFLGVEVEIEKNKIVEAKVEGNLFRGFEKILKGRYALDAVYLTERICGICSSAHALAATLALENALNLVPTENVIYIRDLLHSFDIIQNHIRHFYLFTVPDYVEFDFSSPLYETCHKDYRIPDKLSRKIQEDYLKSIEFSKLAHVGVALLGGKAPHNHGILPGIVSVSLDRLKIEEIKSIINKIKDFVDNCMLEDVNIISMYYGDYFEKGKTYNNFLSFGLFDYEDFYYVKPSVIINGVKSDFDVNKIHENINYSWYEVHDGQVVENIKKKGAYSFVKSPRYDKMPVEVGPLARMILSGKYNLKSSTMDRIIARCQEASNILRIMSIIVERIEPFKKEVKYDFKVSSGLGMVDTTRGALLHYVKLDYDKIDGYDIITPSAWNFSPRDDFLGTVEKALVDTFIDDINDVVEVGRIVRSFDPCISCATHVTLRR
ncbi:hydrogenase large subunit [Caloramator fervidus]|uniref:Hydrogenase large subunit n=1 Tax=Caloramator fervidus TaxID=29344 RepID=A0A1H5VP05_9CLOT|nr:nickel-dependent hydrogenase large subunit [Caloramator fervidus]SEF88247.1 hydrogenase large subunit [Caloramator fervidus]